MADENPKTPNQQNARTLKDDEIVTERKFSRRSFVTVAGTLLAGGAAFLVAGSAATAQDKKDEAADPDKSKDDSSKDKKETKEAATDPDKTKKDKKHKDKDKGKDKDKNKDQATDPDKPKS